MRTRQKYVVPVEMRTWDVPAAGATRFSWVLIEGLALAAFGVLRDMTTVALPKQILAYVMQDEARPVAFGRLALRDYYAQPSAAADEAIADQVDADKRELARRTREVDEVVALGANDATEAQHPLPAP